MRESLSFFAALALAVAATSGAAADEASLLAKAKALIAKTLPKSEEDKIVAGAEKDEAKSGDWIFDIGNDDPGIMRSAGTPERKKRDLQLSMEALAETRCGPERSTKPSITLGSDDRLPLKGTVEKGQYTEAWVSFSDGGAAFGDKPTKLKLDFSQNDGALYLPVEATFFAHHDAVAFCAAAGKPDARCLMFSLKGFARALDFVCQAK
jgi:hypothetical protein